MRSKGRAKIGFPKFVAPRIVFALVIFAILLVPAVHADVFVTTVFAKPKLLLAGPSDIFVNIIARKPAINLIQQQFSANVAVNPPPIVVQQATFDVNVVVNQPPINVQPGRTEIRFITNFVPQISSQPARIFVSFPVRVLPPPGRAPVFFAFPLRDMNRDFDP